MHTHKHNHMHTHTHFLHIYTHILEHAYKTKLTGEKVFANLSTWNTRAILPIARILLRMISFLAATAKNRHYLRNTIIFSHVNKNMNTVQLRSKQYTFYSHYYMNITNTLQHHLVIQHLNNLVSIKIKLIIKKCIQNCISVLLMMTYLMLHLLNIR